MATITVGSVVVYSVPFPFAISPIAFALWYLSVGSLSSLNNCCKMDVTALIFSNWRYQGTFITIT